MHSDPATATTNQTNREEVDALSVLVGNIRLLSACGICIGHGFYTVIYFFYPVCYHFIVIDLMMHHLLLICDLLKTSVIEVSESVTTLKLLLVKKRNDLRQVERI